MAAAREGGKETLTDAKHSSLCTPIWWLVRGGISAEQHWGLIVDISDGWHAFYSGCQYSLYRDRVR
jgi:hypothetical protein